MDVSHDYELVEDLLTSYKWNCETVEHSALNMIYAFEIAVFNNLRDFTIQNCLDALRRLGSWYSVENILEHCVCLTVLTEYICIAYCNNNLYKTFGGVHTKKVTEIFKKLCREWIKILEMELPNEFESGDKFQCMMRNLKKLIIKIPSFCPYKPLLKNTLSFRENQIQIWTKESLKMEEKQNESPIIKRPRVVDNHCMTVPTHVKAKNKQSSLSHYLKKTMNDDWKIISDPLSNGAKISNNDGATPEHISVTNNLPDRVNKKSSIPLLVSIANNLSEKETDENSTSIKKRSKVVKNAFDILMKKQNQKVPL